VSKIDPSLRPASFFLLYLLAARYDALGAAIAVLASSFATLAAATSVCQAHNGFHRTTEDVACPRAKRAPAWDPRRDQCAALVVAAGPGRRRFRLRMLLRGVVVEGPAEPRSKAGSRLGRVSLSSTGLH